MENNVQNQSEKPELVDVEMAKLEINLRIILSAYHQTEGTERHLTNAANAAVNAASKTMSRLLDAYVLGGKK